MNGRIPEEVISGLRQLQQTEDDVKHKLDDIRNKKSLGTVVFFDLVGSTGYRRKYKAEAGLQKAFLHNDVVSRAIIEAGGWVVKWMGDGVLGCFDEHVCGKRHTFKALAAALTALEMLKVLNDAHPLERIAGTDPRNYFDHEVHTKISICSGAFHYFDLTTAVSLKRQVSPGNDKTPSANSVATQQLPYDPMGSAVDLASRLSKFAERGVILIDAATFWGHSPVSEGSGSVAKIQGICDAPPEVIRWRELILPTVRKSVYLPVITAFFLPRAATSIPQTENGSGETGPLDVDASKLSIEFSKFLRAGENALTADDCKELVKRERNGHDDLWIVYAQKPVDCNVAGFDKAVPVLALSLEPIFEPIKPSVHDCDSDIAKAEKFFRAGDCVQATNEFKAIIASDSRDWRALMRLAMLARDANDKAEAMDYLTQCKLANPTCALAWAVAGMVHIEEYYRARTPNTVTRAITGFSRAKELAAKNFHGLLEQYSTCLLAIAYFMRHDPETNDDKDVKAGLKILEELAQWPAKNTVSQLAYQLALVFRDIANKDNAAAVDQLDKMAVEIDTAVNESIKPPITRHDHMVLCRDIKNLGTIAGCLARLV